MRYVGNFVWTDHLLIIWVFIILKRLIRQQITCSFMYWWCFCGLFSNLFRILFSTFLKTVLLSSLRFHSSRGSMCKYLKMFWIERGGFFFEEIHSKRNKHMYPSKYIWYGRAGEMPIKQITQRETEKERKKHNRMNEKWNEIHLIMTKEEAFRYTSRTLLAHIEVVNNIAERNSFFFHSVSYWKVVHGDLNTFYRISKKHYFQVYRSHIYWRTVYMVCSWNLCFSYGYKITV